jgi:hypothetical protein
MSDTQPTNSPRKLAILASLALLIAFASSARPVRASEGEVVTHLALFEINSDGGHDDLARQLSAALRREARAMPGHQLSDARVSLEQLSLVHDCDTAELSCLAKIARQLGVGGFIFGQMQNEGSGAYAEVRLFDAGTQTIKRVSRAMFAQRGASESDISHKAEILISQLLGPEPAPANEAPSARPMLPEVTAPSPAETAAEADASSGVSTQVVAGYALLGGAALSVGLSVFAFVEIDRAQSNENFDRYRRAVGKADPRVKDVCDEAESDRKHGLDSRSFTEVKSECSAGRTFEVLQFVFLGAAAVSGGLSAYLLLSDDGERKPSAFLDALPIHPVVRRNAAELRAKFHF